MGAWTVLPHTWVQPLYLTFHEQAFPSGYQGSGNQPDGGQTRAWDPNEAPPHSP